MTAKRFHGEDEILGKAYDARLMARILRYLRPYWKLLTVSFTFLLLQTGQPVARTLHHQDRHRSATSPNHDIHGLDLMALAYLGGCSLRFRRAVHPDLHHRIHRPTGHARPAGWRYFPICKRRTWPTSTAIAVGRLMTRTVNDVGNAQRTFQHRRRRTVGRFVHCGFGIAAVMLWLDWQLALVCLTAFPGDSLHQPILSPPRARGLPRKPADPGAAQRRACRRTSPGSATVQAFGQEAKMYRRFQRDQPTATVTSCCAACGTTPCFFR